jgi:hypothetical protein
MSIIFFSKVISDKELNQPMATMRNQDNITGKNLSRSPLPDYQHLPIVFLKKSAVKRFTNSYSELIDKRYVR